MVDLFNLEPDDPLNYGMLAAASKLLTPTSQGGGLGPAFGSFGATVSNERRARENQDLVKLRIEAMKRELKDRVGQGDPAAWREWLLVKDLSEKDWLKYMTMKRDTSSIKTINGVPTVVNELSNAQTPLSTLEGEGNAKEILARLAARGKGLGQLETSPPVATTNSANQLQYTLPIDMWSQAGGRLPNMGASPRPSVGELAMVERRRQFPSGYNSTPVSADQFPPHDPPMSQPGLGGVRPPAVGQRDLDIQRAAGIAAANSAQTVADEKSATERQYSELEKIFDKAETLLPFATGSGAGRFVDMATDFIGMSTTGSSAADSLEGLQAHAMRYVPRFKGQDSNRDVQIYKEAIGVLGDRSKPVKNRQDALKTLRDLIKKAKSQEADISASDEPTPAPKADRKSQFKVIRE